MNQLADGIIVYISVLFETMSSSPTIRFQTDESNPVSVVSTVWSKASDKSLDSSHAPDIWTRPVLQMLDERYLGEGVIESIEVNCRAPFGLRIKLDQSEADKDTAGQIMSAIYNVANEVCGGRLKRA